MKKHNSGIQVLVKLKQTKESTQTLMNHIARLECAQRQSGILQNTTGWMYP